MPASSCLEIWQRGQALAEIRKLWLERAAGVGQPVSIRVGDVSVEGIFETLDEQGRLMLRMADGALQTRSAPATCISARRDAAPSAGGFGLMAPTGQLVFAPLGGVGEIGMNLSIYGLGDERRRQWLIVDVGVSFASEEHLPGIDLIFPDIRYLVEERKNIAGIVLTHSHEDHFGALFDLWPKLKVPVYATPFTAALIEAKRAERARRAGNRHQDGAARAAASTSGRSTSNSSRWRIRFRNPTR